MNRFPVLRLPYLALQGVIESIEKTDVLNLAMASRKTYRLIETSKNAVSMEKLSQEDIGKLGVVDRLILARLETLKSSENVIKELDVDVSKQLSLSVKVSYLENDVINKSMMIRAHIISAEDRLEGNRKILFGILQVPVFIASNDTVHTKFDDVEVGFQCLCHHFLQSFNLKRPFILIIDPKHANYNQFSETLRLVIDFVKKTSETPNIKIWSFGLLTNRDFQYVFDSVKYKEIFINGRLTRDRNPGNFACEGYWLYVNDADWFTLEDLINTKCELVILVGTDMTNDLMKEVMINWMDNKLEKLTVLSIELKEDLNIELIISGVSNRAGCFISRTEGSVRIERSDGKAAEIMIPINEKHHGKDLMKKNFHLINHLVQQRNVPMDIIKELKPNQLMFELHWFSIEEAKEFVRQVLEQTSSPEPHLVTGYGLHSKSGESKIKKMLMKVYEKENLII